MGANTAGRWSGGQSRAPAHEIRRSANQAVSLRRGVVDGARTMTGDWEVFIEVDAIAGTVAVVDIEDCRY
ncbi:hypothetical protein AW168_40840 [Nocardia brasiliensis]|nr:hypothetical protein AW168_40840 [Nocardia brasiliensis]